MATSVQEFCQAIAWTRGSRENAAKKVTRSAGGDKGAEGDENEAGTEAGGGEKASGTRAPAEDSLRRSERIAKERRIRDYHSQGAGLRWGGGHSRVTAATVARFREREDSWRRENDRWK